MTSTHNETLLKGNSPIVPTNTFTKQVSEHEKNCAENYCETGGRDSPFLGVLKVRGKEPLGSPSLNCIDGIENEHDMDHLKSSGKPVLN